MFKIAIHLIHHEDTSAHQCVHELFNRYSRPFEKYNDMEEENES